MTAMITYHEMLRQEIEAALDENTRLNADCPAGLKEAIRYSLLAPGKRLRPVLVLAACDVCGGSRNAAIGAACAVEMIHCYSLIHDDLPAMDNDDMRRGRPTNHKRFGEAAAILAGDALIPLAFETLVREPVPAALVRELSAAAGASQLVGGQYDDIDIKPETRNLKQLQHIHSRKTGALIRCSLKLGALIAGADKQKSVALDTYGQHFGLAFQIADDLLDVFGDEQSAGKRVHKDTDKLTYPNLLGIENAKQELSRCMTLAVEALSVFEESNDALNLLCRLAKELDTLRVR